MGLYRTVLFLSYILFRSKMCYNHQIISFAMNLFVLIGVTLSMVVLIILWTGALNVGAIDDESLRSIEKRHPYLPRSGVILVSVVIGGGLFFLSLRYGKSTSIASLQGSASFIRTIVVFALICSFGLFEQYRWHGRKDRYKYLYGFVLGTLVTWILIAFKRAFFETGFGQDPFLMALGITCIVIGWRFLFGPWSESIKATVLGTFIFWVSYAILRFKAADELLATGIAALIGLIPVAIWCRLFLGYHRERISIVLLAFFAGTLSTVPILFYNELVQKKMELNFFLFKIVPVSFGSSSKEFVTESVFQGAGGIQSILLTTLITYLIVGVIEEFSKYWVLMYSSREFFRSIDDILQLAIIVAIGFAFAENLVNPTYFVGFVTQYLLSGPPQWSAFIASVVGRGVLTNMVHILSTGVLGYFFGLAFFASPLLREQFQKGKAHPLMNLLHRMFSIRTETVFARTQIIIGLLLAIVLHGLFDFIVTLPEVLPGNPATVGALLGAGGNSFLHSVSITLLPSLLYVVGGFWLLTYLFEKKEDMKEFGAVVESQSFVLDSGSR